FAFVAHGTAYFRVKVCRDLYIRPAFEFDSMPRVINGNGTIQFFGARTDEHITRIVRFRVLGEQTCTSHGEPSINTLTALAAVALCARLEHEVRTRATERD